MKIPKWADGLINLVITDYQSTRPEINWRRAHSKKIFYNGELLNTREKSKYSSGCTNSKRIAITVGSSRKDARLVLLHELSHWLCPKGEHHGKLFWDLAFELYRKYKVPMYYALNREKRYRKEAQFAYRRNRSKI